MVWSHQSSTIMASLCDLSLPTTRLVCSSCQTTLQSRTLTPPDPLNWPYALKLAVLIQVSFLAFLGPFCQAVINSAFVPLAKAMHITVTVASYNTTVPILFAGVSPLLWSPIANVYGRRPIFIFVTALGILSQCACAAAPTWGGILAARAFVGIGTSAGMGIGAAVVADMVRFVQTLARFRADDDVISSSCTNEASTWASTSSSSPTAHIWQLW